MTSPRVIEEIKDRLDIVDVVSSYLPLKKTGRNYSTLCPFHADKRTPSFIVFPDSQRWNCFGCNRGGDLLDFVMEREGLDFHTALEKLARQAGVTLRTLTPEEKQALQKRCDYEAALGVAAEHFARRLQETPAALAYARGRAWTDEVIRNEGLGYVGGDPPPELGNVEAQRVVEKLNAWAGKVGGALVYVHRDRGRVVYLAGRSIEGKHHYNPPTDVAGPRRPYINGAYTVRSEEMIIVEGQADAVTLGGWGIPAVALAGSGVTGDLGERFKRHAEKGATSYVIPDTDGRTDVAGLAESMGPLLCVVELPEGVSDVNDYAQGGAGADDLQKLLDAASTWLTQEIGRVAGVTGRQKSTAQRSLFELLADLDPFVRTDYRDAVTQALEITVDQFNRFLRAIQGESAVERRNGNGERYVIEGGRMCVIRYEHSGERYAEPLCNFTGQVVEDVAHDDGEDVTRQFTIRGRLDSGRPLPTVQVDASKFMGMTWVNDVWGIQAVVRAGRWRTRDQLREAIQLRSREAESRHVYTHTGWREIDGRRVYLHAGGALGHEGVAVELDRELSRYRLPAQPQDVAEAMEASLRFLEIAPDTITVPLWAAAYLAPLAEIIYPAFVTWLYGVTGTLKSTMVALALSHYGTFTDRDLSLWTDTANRLEKTCFLAKDTLLVIDDFAPASDPYKAREMERNAARIVRNVGNRGGRGRLASDLSLRTTYRPRGLVISTGEQMPDGQSITARMYTVEVRPGDVDLGRLTTAQAEAGRYPHALAGYLLWVAGQWEHLAKTLPQLRMDLRTRLLAEMSDSHLRIPDVLTTLYLGLDLGLAYAAEVGALSDGEAQAWRERGWEALKAGAEAQAKRVERERPTVRFLEVLADLLAQGRVQLEDRNGKGKIGGDAANAERLGWYDERFIYLLPGAAYNRVARFLRDEGGHFPVKERVLRKHMDEEGYLVRGSNGRYTDVVRMGEKIQRVLRVHRNKAEPYISLPDRQASVRTGDDDGSTVIPF